MENKNNLEDLIKESDFKIIKIAERMGIRENRLWRLRQNPERLRVDVIIELSKAMDLDPRIIFEAIINGMEGK